MPGDMIHRRTRRSFVAACLAAVALSAPPGAGRVQAATSSQAVIGPIEQLDQALLTIMRYGRRTSFQQRYATLAPAVERALDLRAILATAVGPSWTSLQPQEQQTLLQAFAKYTIATYVNNFDSYNGQTLTVSPQTRAVGSSQVVQTRIQPRSGEGHTIAYVMRPMTDGTWKATDVLADGTISRVAVLRADFRQMLAQGGAPALVASLNKKAADLENG